MADFRKLVGHTLKWEGGLSADPRDTGALKYGHSGVKADKNFPNNFVHTNKGIIWGTYLEYCTKKGKSPNAGEFISMPERLWMDIYKTVFWDSVFGDRINSQAIAEILMEARWIGGTAMLKALVKTMQLQVGVLDDGIIGEKTLKALNSYTKTKANETKLADAMLKRQLDYYKGLSNWATYGKGWTNRIEALRLRVYDAIAKGLASNTGRAVLGAMILAGLAYVYRNELRAFYLKQLKSVR